MKTVIVIPVYREMYEVERISLQQALCIFRAANETLCLIAPVSMDVSSYLAYGDFLVERFPDAYFTGTVTYSRLLLTTSFYERFSAFDYLLIYQLDAFVFRDELTHFCALGYDYYGAPWPLMLACHRVARNAVGNGGLSLRHVAHTIQLLHKYHEVIECDWWPSLTLAIGEDVFFCWA